MLLLLGLVDFGKAFTMWIDQTHIANQAGRFAAVNSWTDSGGVKQPVETSLSAFEDAMEDDGDTKELRDSFDTIGSTPPNGVHVCFPATSNGAVGDSIRVDVRARYQFLGFIGDYAPSLVPAKLLSAHSVMRIERQYAPSFAGTHHC